MSTREIQHRPFGRDQPQNAEPVSSRAAGTEGSLLVGAVGDAQALIVTMTPRNAKKSETRDIGCSRRMEHNTY